MFSYKVLQTYFDLVLNEEFNAGDSVMMTEERASEIEETLRHYDGDFLELIEEDIIEEADEEEEEVAEQVEVEVELRLEDEEEIDDDEGEDI